MVIKDPHPDSGMEDFGYKESLDRSIGKFASFAAGVSYISILTGSVPFDMNTLRRGYPTTDNGFCLTPNVTQGRSRGTVRLRSRDYRDRAKVDPRYFTDPEG